MREMTAQIEKAVDGAFEGGEPGFGVDVSQSKTARGAAFSPYHARDRNNMLDLHALEISALTALHCQCADIG